MPEAIKQANASGAFEIKKYKPSTSITAPTNRIAVIGAHRPIDQA
jgi:hypothetical protein